MWRSPSEPLTTGTVPFEAKSVSECLIQHAAPINRILDTALGAFIEVLDQHTLQDLVSARPPAHEARSGDRIRSGLNLAGLMGMSGQN